MAKTLDFDVFDARQGAMEAFTERLQEHGGRPLPLAVERDGSGLRLTLDAAVPDGAAFGYGVVLAPAPDYLRCVMFAEQGSTAAIHEAIRDHRSAAFAAMLSAAKRMAADAVPGLMAGRGMPVVGDPVVFHGDPDRGGMAVLRMLVRHTHDDDLTPGDAERTFELLRVGDTVVFAIGFEIASLDPFAVVVLYCGSEASRQRFQSVHEDGETNGPRPPDRRAEARRQLAWAAFGQGAERPGPMGHA